MSKQISITIPQNIYEETSKQYDELGFRSVQEYILDSHRRRLLAHKRHKDILNELKKNGKRLSQKEAMEYLERLTEKIA